MMAEEDVILPMDETELVNGFNCQDALCDIEPCDILGESIVLDEHSHQVPSRQELHDEV